MKDYSIIDWISYTVNARDALAGALPKGVPTAGMDGAGNMGYTSCYALHWGGKVYTNPDRPEMGVHVVLSGAACDWLREKIYGTNEELLQAVMSVAGAKIRRLDLAVDIMGDDAFMGANASAITSGDYEGKSRKVSEIKSNGGGHTVYVGGRTSERFIRMYNKGAQMNSEGLHWTRVELELKKTRAHNIAKFLLNHDVSLGVGIKEAINEMLCVNTSGWARVFGDGKAETRGSTKNADGTRIWLLGTAARSLAKYVTVNDDRKFLEEFMRHVVAEMDALTAVKTDDIIR